MFDFAGRMKLEEPLKNAAATNFAGPGDASELRGVLLLCVLGALHVLVFSATFPFFNVVDEQFHFDLVVRYSQGDIPRAVGPPCESALPYIVLFGTTEYLWTPESQPGGHFAPPPWKLPLAEVQPKLNGRLLTWRTTEKNYEATQPPLYYAIAGLWWRLWQHLGLVDGPLLYLARFFNALVVAALVWLGWAAARKIFPENNFIRMAVPALVALMPQTAFYSVNNDIFSPLTFALGFVLLLNFWDAESPSPRLAFALGFALAATFLAKISNLPLLAAAGGFLALKVFSLARKGKLRAFIFPLLILFFAAVLPMAVWMAWCKINFGDLTGSNLKIQFFGLTQKPFAEWFHHPIFTPAGGWFFVSENLSTFWQGEFLWRHQPLAIPAVDKVYIVLTLGAFLFALIALLRRPPPFTTPQRAALWFGFACIIASFAFYAWLSVQYDFHDCFRPSRALPFFVSGRMMLGMLVPFLVLFACGLDRLMNRLQSSTKLVVLIALLAFMLASEITIDWPVFPNEYNWLHL